MLDCVTEDLPPALLADLARSLLANDAVLATIRTTRLRYDVCSRYHEHEDGHTPCTPEQINATFHIISSAVAATELQKLAPFEHYLEAKV